MNGELNKVTATLKVVVTGDFYEDNVSEDTLRYFVEQDLEDDGFDVNVELLKEQEPVHPIKQYDGNPGDWASWWYVCGNCERDIDCYDKFCRSCGRAVKWDGSD